MSIVMKNMSIPEMMRKFPKHEDCIKHIELVRWENKPRCPYCGSPNHTPMPKEMRYHCNNCNTSYAVTVGTIFHNTKLPLQKWFLAIGLVLNAKKGISARQLARDIDVTKDTAWRISMQIRKAMYEYGDLLQGIIEADETYIGGKNKNRHKDKKTTGGQGRGGDDKTPVFGMVERDGKVKAKTVKNVKKATLQKIIMEHVKKGSTVMTDEWVAYKGLDKKYAHKVINHGIAEYVNGDIYTNTIENFWSMFKRGFIGQYHQLSKRYLNRYLDEFCYRYNNRNNEFVFLNLLRNGVCV